MRKGDATTKDTFGVIWDVECRFGNFVSREANEEDDKASDNHFESLAGS